VEGVISEYDAPMTFGTDIYDLVRAGMVRSAATVVPEVMRVVEPTRVVDVGCGQGVWLAEFARHGCEVLGYDTHDGAHLDIPPESYTRIDLETAGRLGVGSADLAVCLEVGEHLSAQRSQWLVETLCQADVVLFSAAIPGQGGHGHINEQWPSYWADLFRANHFAVSGAFRWQFWDRVPDEIEVWYAQNLLLCASEPVAHTMPPGLFDSPLTDPYPVVHPRYWTIAKELW
jgi:SAM-dependent methyltransferase